MGLFFKKTVRRALDRKNLAGSYVVLALCLILIAINIIAFISFPRLLSPIAIILSNVITMLITALAFRPINNLIQEVLESREEELAAKMEAEKQMQQKMDMLESRNRELEDKLDIRSQTGYAQSDVNFTFKLEQMEYARKGYVVKEEELDSLADSEAYKDKIPGKGFLPSLLENINLKTPGTRKILYIKKFYYKVSVGIDFTRIKYAFDDGSILFAGVKFMRLHDITSELEQDERDIDHTWIVNTADDKVSLVQGPEYDKLKESYSRIQEAGTREALEEEVDRLCQQYTQVLRSSIQERFPRVEFVDGIEDSESTWYALKEAGKDPRVSAVASSMLMLSDVINRTQE